MKKTSLIILTIVASLSVSLSSAQDNPPTKTSAPDYLYESENKAGNVKYDTLKRNRRDSVVQNPNIYYYQQPQITFNYYYRNRFANTVFRIFAPRRYQRLVSRPGFVPTHLRPVRSGRSSRSGESSAKRGGFGSAGRTQFN